MFSLSVFIVVKVKILISVIYLPLKFSFQFLDLDFFKQASRLTHEQLPPEITNKRFKSYQKNADLTKRESF